MHTSSPEKLSLPLKYAMNARNTEMQKLQEYSNQIEKML
jgi:hypothetical protein